MEPDLVVGTALVKMYGRCWALADARIMFEKMLPNSDVVLWTTMITACVQQGYCKEALHLFQEMHCQCAKPSKITFVTILHACCSLEVFKYGKIIHDCIQYRGIETDMIVSNALLNMYLKCDTLEDAENLFFKMPQKDEITWTVMIAAYAQADQGEEARFLFQEMHQMGIKPDKFTFCSVLDACGSLSALVEGNLIYSYIVESGIELDVVIGNALISMYGKCGTVEDACKVFVKMPEQDGVSWSAVTAAYSHHGCGKGAAQLFWEMQLEGLKPSKVMFINVLSACSHAGLIDEGCQYFISMIQDYGITPMVEHYMCMVDLMGRAGCMREAEALVEKVPLQPSEVLWNTLLGACRIHGHVDIGQRAAESVLELDPHHEAGYVVLSNMYAAAGRWLEAAMVRKAMVISSMR